MDDSWDDAKVATLLSLKADGLTMREIAKSLGVTRNAVIGKLARIRNASFREGFRAKERPVAAPRPAPSTRVEPLPAPAVQPLVLPAPPQVPRYETYRPKIWNSRLSYEEMRPYHDRLKVGMRVRPSEDCPYRGHVSGVVVKNDPGKPYAKVRWDDATCDHNLHKSFIEPDVVIITSEQKVME